MTSFLNKKFSLILVILATLIIATSITSVSAAEQTTNAFPADVDLQFVGSNLTTKNVSYGQSVDVVFSAYNPNAGPLYMEGDLILRYFSYSDPTIGDHITIPINWTIAASTNKTQTFNINTADFTPLGDYKVYMEFINTAPTPLGGDFIDDFDSYNAVGVTNPFVLTLVYMDTPTIVWDNPAGLKVGQEGNITGTLFGRNASNATQVIPLGGIVLDFALENGTVIGTFTTNANGTFVLPYTPQALSFKIVTNTNLSASTNPDAGLYEEIVNLSHAFSAAQGEIKADIWWDSPVGYLVGNNSTVFWNLTNVGDLTGTNILAWILLYDYDNPNVELRKFIVPLWNPTTIGTVSSDGHWNFTDFIKTHDKLMVRLVIDGRDLNNSLVATYGSSIAEADTFVYTENAKPVKITNNLTAEFSGIKAGVNYAKQIIVEGRLPGSAPVNGLVKLLFDGKWEFIVPVINGVATFNHTFSIAGANRFVEANFIANPDENLSSSPKEKAIFPVAKGVPVLVVTQLPNPFAAFAGEEATITTLISGFAGAAATAPKNITLEFSEGGKVVHTEIVPITPDEPIVLADGTFVFATTGSAILVYTYKLTHAALTITAKLGDGTVNYENATNSIVVTVV
ncbi:MAG: hypothetical protein LBU74_07385 [Methanobacteriaceae archaeon]|jgi:hypothetical protein|nr:hypothetical protein [Candidatus Methanorudis spinitermitis]